MKTLKELQDAVNATAMASFDAREDADDAAAAAEEADDFANECSAYADIAASRYADAYAALELARQAKRGAPECDFDDHEKRGRLLCW